MIFLPTIAQVRLPRALLNGGAAGIALLLGACSCDELEPWGATYITAAEAAYGQPACEVDASAAAMAEASGANVDPKLVEIARLEVERDCYKGAEADLRERLQGAPALK